MCVCCCFFNDTWTTEIYTYGQPLSLHDSLPICPIAVSRPVLTTWAIMAILTLAAWLITRRLKRDRSRLGTSVELLVAGLLEQIEGITRTPPRVQIGRAHV